MRLAVAGGTGVIGRHVVEVAQERGHEVVVLARARGVDLATGAGLGEALEGVAAVVDAANVVTQRRGVAEAFFTGVTERLVAAEQRAGTGHHVVLSIVGIDDVPTGYYAAKLAQERAAAAGPVPWSVLRATQVHEFAEQALGFASLRLPLLGRVSAVPRMLCQPVAAREVGEALVDLVERGPAGRVPDLAGPQRRQLLDLARRVARHRPGAGHVVGVRLPSAAGRAMRAGRLCPDPHDTGPRGRVTFDDWLAARPG